jgi:hypothetical protein
VDAAEVIIDETTGEIREPKQGALPPAGQRDAVASNAGAAGIDASAGN